MRSSRLLALAACAVLFACSTDDESASDGAAPGADVSHDAASGVDTSDPGTDAADPSDSGGTIPGGVTYHGEIRALMEAECVTCHSAGGIGPFALDTFESASTFGAASVAAVTSGAMPPWQPDESCRDIQYDRHLEPEQVDAFVAWRDNGFAEGDPANYQAPDMIAAPDLGEPDLLIDAGVDYSADPDRPDDYRCLPLQATFDENTYVTATDIFPDERDIVHHVLLYLVEEDEVARLEQMDAEDPGPGYTCFGGPGVGGGTLAGWVPGSVPMAYPDDTAIVIPAGSRVVMQIHYNTSYLESPDDIAPDRTEVAFWTLPDGEVPHERVRIVPYAHHEIEILAGDPQSSHQREFGIPVNANVIGVAPHMHTLGSSISSRILRADGSETCVADIPEWDFNWQQFYLFEPDDFLEVGPGDRHLVSCSYDNSPGNQPVVNGERLEPRDVYWGEGTFDEMCLIYLIATFPYVPDDGTTCGGFQACYSSCDEGDADCFVGCAAGGNPECAQCVFSELTPCVTEYCGAEGLTFNACLSDCDDGTYECIRGACGAEFDALFACVDPHVRAGDCDDDIASCEIQFGE